LSIIPLGHKTVFKVKPDAFKLIARQIPDRATAFKTGDGVLFTFKLRKAAERTVINCSFEIFGGVFMEKLRVGRPFVNKKPVAYDLAEFIC